MKTHPVMEELIDLRHKIHILNAEKFLDVKREYHALIQHINDLPLPQDARTKFESHRNKGNYLSVRGSSNFVRYAYRLMEVNNSLRRLLVEHMEIN